MLSQRIIPVSRRNHSNGCEMNTDTIIRRAGAKFTVPGHLVRNGIIDARVYECCMNATKENLKLLSSLGVKAELEFEEEAC